MYLYYRGPSVTDTRTWLKLNNLIIKHFNINEFKQKYLLEVTTVWVIKSLLKTKCHDEITCNKLAIKLNIKVHVFWTCISLNISYLTLQIFCLWYMYMWYMSPTLNSNERSAVQSWETYKFQKYPTNFSFLLLFSLVITRHTLYNGTKALRKTQK